MAFWLGIVAAVVVVSGLLGFAVGYVIGMADEKAARMSAERRRSRRDHPTRLRLIESLDTP